MDDTGKALRLGEVLPKKKTGNLKDMKEIYGSAAGTDFESYTSWYGMSLRQGIRTAAASFTIRIRQMLCEKRIPFR